MVEGAGLENRYMCIHIAGSNPALSAIILIGGGSFITERCQSGLMGTLGKRVWGFLTAGSNPVLSAIINFTILVD